MAHVCGNKNLPFADVSLPWDAAAASKKMAAAARGRDTMLDPAKMARGFILCDGDPTLVSSYKLPFADIIDGELKAVPRALFAAAARLDQVQGGGQDAARTFLEGYYKRLKRPTPWATATAKSASDWIRKKVSERTGR